MKYLSILTVLLVVLLLTGCFYQTVNQFDIQRASKACGGVEKIVGISATFIGDESALCKNGKKNGLHKVSVE